MHLNPIARSVDQKVLNAQETQKVIAPEDYDFLPPFLEEQLQQLLPKQPGINY
jgi:hypothetical protein